MYRFLLVALALSLALPALASAKPPGGPADLSFYDPPPSLVSGKPGSVIWQRPVTVAPVRLKYSASTTLLLYRSRSVSGKPVVVSGTLDLPKGKPPRQGWPIISWAHGTTGMADVCAPSRNVPGGPADSYISYTDPMLSSWLKKGFAVARTDYEGLATPGDHPYLIGGSAGRSVVDMARAARRLDTRLSRSFLVAGHSQGGQAALFAAAGAKSWAPELKLKGALVFAPASHIYDQKSLLPSLATPSPLSTLALMILTSAARAEGKDPASFLSSSAAAMIPRLDSECAAQLNQPGGTADLVPSQLLLPGADDASLDPTIKAMNPAVSSTAPVLLLQGLSDSTVFSLFTDQLASELRAKRVRLEYKTFPGLDHSGVVINKASQGKGTAWAARRLR